MLRPAALAALFAASLSIAGCATTTTTTTKPGEPAAGAFHTMKPGETIWDLSRQTGLSVDEIVEVNGLPSADEVSAGQVIFLPAGAGPVVDAPVERAEPEPAASTATLVWPVVAGVVLRDFSPGKYDGLLIAAPADTVVVAAADGAVAFAGDQGTAYGLFVVVEHKDCVTVYGHLARADVKAGDRVTAGGPIGVVGVSGGQESPRLHFEVRRGRTVVDPLSLLPRTP